MTDVERVEPETVEGELLPEGMTLEEFRSALRFIPQRYDPEVPVGDLVPWPGNPRLHDRARIRESVGVNGFAGAVLAQEGTGRIISGHGRLQDVIDAGGTHVPVLWLDVDDDTGARLLIALNTTEDHASYENRQLADFLAELAATPIGLAGTAVSSGELDLLLTQLAEGGTPLQDPQDEWVGMPEFDQQDRQSGFTTTVHFLSADRADEFFREVFDRPKAQRSVWWPEDDGHVGSDQSQEYVVADGED